MYQGNAACCEPRPLQSKLLQWSHKHLEGQNYTEDALTCTPTMQLEQLSYKDELTTRTYCDCNRCPLCTHCIRE